MNVFIPIPIWTGVVLGVALALAAAVWLSFWLYRREQKRETDLIKEAYDKAVTQQVGQDGSSGQ